MTLQDGNKNYRKTKHLKLFSKEPLSISTFAINWVLWKAYVNDHIQSPYWIVPTLKEDIINPNQASK